MKITAVEIESEIWCNNQLGWIAIPKNGNMATRRLCDRLNMRRQPYTGQQPEKLFCVIRDPQTRLISGLNEFKMRKLGKNYFNWPIQDLLEMLLDKPHRFDEHLEPQALYLGEHRFDYVCKFENIFQDICDIPEIPVVHTEKTISQAKANSSKAGKIDVILADNRCLVDAVLEKYYQQDLEIYNNPQTIMR